jgi:hypothetical protein
MIGIESQQTIDESKQHMYDFISTSSPSNFTIFGWTEKTELGGPIFDRQLSAGRRIDLGQARFNLNAAQKRSDKNEVYTQSFILDKNSPGSGLHSMTFHIDSNEGNNRFTCVYRIKVFGHLPLNFKNKLL